MMDPRTLQLDPDQPRENLDSEHVTSIATKIQHEGFDERKFITVRKTKGGIYIVQDGNHRLVASVEAGVKEIPVFLIEEDSDLTVEEEAVLRLDQCADNMGRPMKPMEIINTCESAIESGVPLDEIAGKMGKSVQSIQRDRILAKAPGKLKEELTEGTLSKQVVVHLTEIAINRENAGEKFNVTKAVKKAKSGGKNMKTQIAAIDKYIAEVILSDKGRSKSMFDKDQTSTEKTEKLHDKGWITDHNDKDFTVKNAGSLWKALGNGLTRYLEGPLGNGHAGSITKIPGMTAFEVRHMAKEVKRLYEKLDPIATEMEAVVNA